MTDNRITGGSNHRIGGKARAGRLSKRRRKHLRKKRKARDRRVDG